LYSTSINDCNISNNRAEINGGGIANDGTMTMYSCIIENNYADGSGGAMAIFDETGLVIEGNTISNNSASHGGGIMLWLTSLVGTMPDIGGVYQSEKNTICGNYKGTDAASVHQAIRNYSSQGSLYEEYRYTNNITANCPQ
jgi:parallel beta-helix repeat protein